MRILITDKNWGFQLILGNGPEQGADDAAIAVEPGALSLEEIKSIVARISQISTTTIDRNQLKAILASCPELREPAKVFEYCFCFK